RCAIYAARILCAGDGLLLLLTAILAALVLTSDDAGQHPAACDGGIAAGLTPSFALIVFDVCRVRAPVIQTDALPAAGHFFERVIKRLSYPSRSTSSSSVMRCFSAL